MLLSHDSRCTHNCSQSVDGHLCQRPGIFVSDHAGDGPRYGGMVGRKRNATLEKVAESRALIGAFSSKRIFQCRIDSKTINRSFSRKNACFPLVIVVRNLAPDVESAAGANQGIQSVVGNARVAI